GARARALGGGRAGRGARPGGVGARARAAARRAHRPPGGALPPRAGAGARAGADRRPRRRARARAPLVDARRARARRRARLAALPRRGRARGDYGLGVEVFVIVHLLAACVWVGGAVALVVAGVPAIRVLEGEPRGRAMRELGLRWRPLGYGALLVLAVTGVPLAQHDYDEGRSPFQTVLWVKVGLAAALVVASYVHNFVLGPRLQ